jgi:hypothetical protein
MFAVFLSSVLVDALNLLRLIHWKFPEPAWLWVLPWVAAILSMAALVWLPQRKWWWRVGLWILLGVATFLMSALSDGSNLSLWTMIAFASGPSADHSSRLVAGVCWGVHAVAQFALLPLGMGAAATVYGVLASTGILGTLWWHWWGSPFASRPEAP